MVLFGLIGQRMILAHTQKGASEEAAARPAGSPFFVTHSTTGFYAPDTRLASAASRWLT
jgi:hypothetical protein